MFTRIRNHVWGPADKIIAAVLGLALVATLVVVVMRALPEDCGEGLKQVGPDEECIGVTEKAYVFDENIEGLIKAVAKENAQVRKDFQDPESPVPFVRIALMMPFTTDEDDSSAMKMELIRNSLAGALSAQLQANQDSGLQYQLLLANNGKDLDHWEPVVDQLAGLTGGEHPLVGVIGFPNSVPETQEAAEALSKKGIPAFGATITSPDMSAGHLFKTSPSNEHFAQALKRYLNEKPSSGNGFLVSDSRERDNYSANLREVFIRHFAQEYGLRTREARFLGRMGKENLGVPGLFSSVAQKICLSEPDVIFYAGRDEDLPGLISKLADQPSCDHEKPMRIIKAGVGADRVLTTPEITKQLREIKITLVNAASVDPNWWPGGTGEAPRGFKVFYEQMEKVDGQLAEQSAKSGLALPEDLNDGYALMFHDAFTVVVAASDQFFDETNGDAPAEDAKGTDNKLEMPTSDDVYNTVMGLSILGTEDGSDCTNCIRGASGTFGYDADPSTDHWPICKPVPVSEYPDPWPSEAGEQGGSAGEIFRTHQDLYGGKCP